MQSTSQYHHSHASSPSPLPRVQRSQRTKVEIRNLKNLASHCQSPTIDLPLWSIATDDINWKKLKQKKRLVLWLLWFLLLWRSESHNKFSEVLSFRCEVPQSKRGYSRKVLEPRQRDQLRSIRPHTRAQKHSQSTLCHAGLFWEDISTLSLASRYAFHPRVHAGMLVTMPVLKAGRWWTLCKWYKDEDPVLSPW